MSQSLPPAIVAQLTALGTALVAAAHRHQGGSLAELEAGVRTTVHAALGGLLGAVVGLATPDLDAGIATVQRRCPRCDRLVGMIASRDRTVRTTCGSLAFTRPWYHCHGCHHGFSPVDSALALPPAARISPALQEWLVRLAATAPPRESAALLTELTGLVVHHDTLRQHATTVGTALAAADAAAIAQVQSTREAAEPVDPAPGTLVVEADGAMVRYLDSWHEVKIGVVGGTTGERLTAQSYVAARESAESFGPRLLAEAARRGALEVVRWQGPPGRPALAVLRPVHVVGDGAAWIWNLAAEHFGDRTEVLDYYHAAEHLWAVARAMDGADTAEARVGATVCIRAMRAGGYAPVQRALAALRPLHGSEAAEVVRKARGYFAGNAARMDYPTIEEQGLPIGSGAVESSAKHLVQHRMKRPGQRWSEPGATAMLALRGRLGSGRPLARPA